MARFDDRKMFYGWWVVIAIFWVAFFGPMGRYILTPLFPFLKEEMGWSREVIGAVFTLQFWSYSIMSVLVGRMIDKVGARVIVFLGGAFLLLGLVLLSFSRHLWHFYLIYGFVLSFSVSMIHLGPNTIIVRKWFVRKAGLATGFITVGTALGQGVMIPAVGGLIWVWTSPGQGS